MPEDPYTAVARVLEHEALLRGRVSASRSVRLLRRVRTTLDEWQAGVLSADAAAQSLRRLLTEPQVPAR
jgi:hypothetical protein